VAEGDNGGGLFLGEEILKLFAWCARIDQSEGAQQHTRIQGGNLGGPMYKLSFNSSLASSWPSIGKRKTWYFPYKKRRGGRRA